MSGLWLHGLASLVCSSPTRFSGSSEVIHHGLAVSRNFALNIPSWCWCGARLSCSAASARASSGIGAPASSRRICRRSRCRAPALALSAMLRDTFGIEGLQGRRNRRDARGAVRKVRYSIRGRKPSGIQDPAFGKTPRSYLIKPQNCARTLHRRTNPGSSFSVGSTGEKATQLLVGRIAVVPRHRWRVRLARSETGSPYQAGFHRTDRHHQIYSSFSICILVLSGFVRSIKQPLLLRGFSRAPCWSALSPAQVHRWRISP